MYLYTYISTQIFICKSGAHYLSKTKRIFFDGTFATTPRIARNQVPFKGALYILAGVKAPSLTSSPVVVPCLCILFTGIKSTEQLYRAAILDAQSRCKKEYNIDIINKEKMLGMGDFEDGLRNAIQSIWPSIQLKACFFHYAQAIRSNIDKKGLSKYYRSSGTSFDIKIYVYFRMFITLALLPPALVPRAYNILVRIYEEGIAIFICICIFICIFKCIFKCIFICICVSISNFDI